MVDVTLEPIDKYRLFDSGRIFNCNCVDMFFHWRGEKPPFDLALFSTPYPSMLGWNVKVNDYLTYWLPEKLSHITMDMSNKSVIIQNIWFPRLKYGGYDNRIFKIPDIYSQAGWNLEETLIWDKKNAPPSGNMKRHDHNEWEFVFVFAQEPGYTYHKFRQPYAKKTVGKAATGNMRKPDLNGKLAGGHSNLHPEGAAQGNILRYSPSGDQGRPRIKGRVFPRGLAERLILQYSNPGDIVYDPFCGSGTTLIMATANGRQAVGCDTDPYAYEVACNWLGEEDLKRSREKENA